MSSQYYVTTRDPKRRALWNRLFDTDVLPIKSPVPSMSPCLSLAYRLDAHRLSHPTHSQTRLVGWLVMFRGLDYDEARKMVREGYPINIIDCDVIKQEQGTPAFSLVHLFRYASPSHAALHYAGLS